MTATIASRRRRRRPAGEFAGGASLLRARELGIGLAIVIVFVVTTVKNHAFANAHSMQQLLTGAALIALLGVGETLVIVTRNVDLSVGSVVGLSAYVVGDLFKHHPGIPVLLGFVLGIAIGAGFGAVNGLIITVLRVPSLVVTLAMLYIIRGIDGVIVNGSHHRPRSIPKTFKEVGYKTILGVPWLAIIVVVVVAVVGTRCAPSGRPRSLRDRLEPRGGRAGRHPGRAPGLHRLRRQRRARRAGRRAVPRPARAGRRHRRHRLRAAGRGGGRRRRRRDLRRSAARWSAPRSARCC